MANRINYEELDRAYRAVCSFPEGVQVLRHICELTGYRKALTSVNQQGEINVQASLNNLAKRDLWQVIQMYLDDESKVKIEAGG